MFNANKKIAASGLNDAFMALVAMECYGNLSESSVNKLEDMMDSLVDMMEEVEKVNEES